MALDLEQCHSKEVSSLHSEHMGSMSTTASMQHQGHEMLMSVADDAEPAVESAAQCCCDADSSCVSNCDIGMMASLVVQHSTYSPVFIAANETIVVSASLTIRDITPPSRPPAVYS